MIANHPNKYLRDYNMFRYLVNRSLITSSEVEGIDMSEYRTENEEYEMLYQRKMDLGEALDSLDTIMGLSHDDTIQEMEQHLTAAYYGIEDEYVNVCRLLKGYTWDNNPDN